MARRRPGAETIAYAVVALVLIALMWRHVRQVDGFFLDEWFYVGGAEYMWDNLPFAAFGDIPLWNRGPQRLYSLLIAPPYGLLSTSTAYDVAHAINMLLLASAVVPAALLARRVIEQPWMRVLAVVLAVGIPWLTISLHLLTENLAFPLYLWAAYAIVNAAERPSLRAQALALVTIGLLGLCRLNLALMFGVLVLAVLAAEIGHRRDRRGEPLRAWGVGMLKREALVIAATVFAVIVAASTVVGGSEALGAYGGLDAGVVGDRLFGEQAAVTRRDLLTYLRGLVTGTFVLPFTLGLGVALAGVTGRLGRPLLVPSVVALGGLLVVLPVVGVYTSAGAVEERYVFPIVAPLAILAVTGASRLAAVRPYLWVSSAVVLWTLIAGYGRNFADSGNFFAAPAGAFWSRVVHHRVRAYEEDLFGWMFIAPTGWLLLAVALGALLGVAALARRRAAIATAVVSAGLGVCALAQLAALDYDFKQELHGTRDVPGGLALSANRSLDREDFADRLIPDGRTAVMIPAVSTQFSPYGAAEKVQFWNRDVAVAVALGWPGAPAPASPRMSKFGLSVNPQDGLARFERVPPEYLVAQPDDPRVQMAGEILGRAKALQYAVMKIDPRRRALWSATGIEGDGAMVQGTPVVFRLDGQGPVTPRAVEVDLHGVAGAARPVRWRLEGGGEERTGRLGPGQKATLRLEVPRCPDSDCVHEWTLTASGTPTGLNFPGYGAPGDARPVMLSVLAVRIGS